MRIFISVDIPADIKEKIADFQAELKKTDIFKAKFVEKENLHLALKFIGEISEGDTAKISKQLENICKEHGSFQLSLRGLGAFPSENYIRVLWIGIKQGVKETKALHEDINKALNSKESRDFVGHLTLARVKAVTDKKKLASLFEKHKEIDFGGFVVKSIKLMKSELTREGPVYSVVKEFKLTY